VVRAAPKTTRDRIRIFTWAFCCRWVST
jgi:hypothetical protein